MNGFLVVEVKKHVFKYVGRTDVKHTYEVIGVVDERTAEEKFSKSISYESAGSGMFIGFRWYKVLDNEELMLYCNEYGEYVGVCEDEDEVENVAVVAQTGKASTSFIELLSIDGFERNFEDSKAFALEIVKGNPLLERAISDSQNLLNLCEIVNALFGKGTASVIRRKDNAPAIYEDVIGSLKIIIADYIERGEYENAKSSLNDLTDWESRKEEMLNEIRKGAGYLARNLPLFYSLVDDDMF